MKTKLMIAIALALPISVAIAEVPKTAGDAAAAIERQGAASFLSGLNPDEVDQLYEHFDNGEAEWLPLVPKLAGVADAGNAEGLTISLAFALPKNPQGVLALVTEQDGVLGVGRVCSMPFIEDTTPKGYRTKAMAAVRKVGNPALRKAKDLCLRALKRSR
jgi:hypothetical protein